MSYNYYKLVKWYSPMVLCDTKRMDCMVTGPEPVTWQALTLDCGNHWPGGPVNQKIHWPPKNM